MFDLMLILAYVIPSIYIFFRVKLLFISKGYQRWYVFIYLLIGILPMVARFGHRGTPVIVVLNVRMTDRCFPLTSLQVVFTS